jgi:hypothetical protein
MSIAEYVSIPAIMHFMPGCADNAQEWKNVNPGFLGIQWDDVSLRDVIQNVPLLRDAKPKNTEESRLIETVAVAFTFGGVCMSVPMAGVCPLKQTLLEYPTSLLIVFGEIGSEIASVDTSLMISSARISAMLSLFDLFVKAPQHDFKTIMKDFIKASAQASKDGAIKTLPMSSLRTFVNAAPSASSSLNLDDLVMHLSTKSLGGKKVHITSSTMFSEQLRERLIRGGALRHSDSSNYDIIIIDNPEFDYEKPVSQALAIANEFQIILSKCNSGGIVVFSNAPQDQTGADMFVRQQLEFMKAKPQWFPNSSQSAVWQLITE